MVKKKQKPITKIGEIEVPLQFNLPVDMPSVYATNMLVQASDQEIILSFFEAQPPFFTEDAKDNIELLKSVGVRADCVAKVIISPARFEGFVGVLNRVAEKIKAEGK
jgi:hypothetical protein